MIKPPISYMGGKIKMANQINKIVQKCKPKCVVDLFGGSGAILLNITNVKSKIYNDLDSEIVNMYKVIQNKENFEKLEEWLDITIASREIFNEFKYADIDNLSPLDRAKRTIYLWTMAFAGRRSSETSFNFGYSNKRKPIKLDKNRIKGLYDIVKEWYIENLDYKEIIKKYDSPDTLFIIDPPYFIENKNTKYYKHNLPTKEEQIEIKDNIDQIKGKVIITYPNTEFYKKLYQEYNIINSSKRYSTISDNYINNKIESNELIITNWSI